ncbi:MAG: tRNA (guanosine(37)-N1)-methyltransferase TrmD [Caldilineae bacterium]|nr:MAG: tRNA (guanosine(37)-N1)-methyltransferase TrmD [Caldilineae bacterium]
MQFDIFTLFPQMFAGVFSESILKRAQEKGLVRINVHDIRAYTSDKHHVCDGPPYGGGGGMVMKPEPIFRAVETVLSHPPGWSLPPEDAYTHLPPWDPDQPPPLPEDAPIILLTPQGRRFDQEVALELAQRRRIALICGRYEGVDERVRTQLATDELSIGDYVLSGGELPAMVVVDAVTRLAPGALGDPWGAHRDSHSPGADGLLEGPHYTRPFTFRGESVPEVLTSGHHAQVERWRREQSLLRTLQRRPDLLDRLAARGGLTPEDEAFLRAHGWAEERHRHCSTP